MELEALTSSPLFVPLVFSNMVYFEGFKSPAFVLFARGITACVPVLLVTAPAIGEGI